MPRHSVLKRCAAIGPPAGGTRSTPLVLRRRRSRSGSRGTRISALHRCCPGQVPGAGPARPLSPWSSASIAAICSGVISKSRTARFSAMPSGSADSRMMMWPCLSCRRRMICAVLLPLGGRNAPLRRAHNTPGGRGVEEAGDPWQRSGRASSHSMRSAQARWRDPRDGTTGPGERAGGNTITLYASVWECNGRPTPPYPSLDRSSTLCRDDRERLMIKSRPGRNRCSGR